MAYHSNIIPNLTVIFTLLMYKVYFLDQADKSMAKFEHLTWWKKKKKKLGIAEVVGLGVGRYRRLRMPVSACCVH